MIVCMLNTVEGDSSSLMHAHTSPRKICFVIAPIGATGSDTRSRSDKIFQHIISPVVTECGYEPLRTDFDTRPGMIGRQIINYLVDAELVIADLTGHNANVFYELAIRHMVKKPIVQLMQDGERLPVDLIQSRTIFVDHKDLDSVAKCKTDLADQILAVEKDPSLVDNPISETFLLKALEQSTNPAERRDADILRRLDELSSQVLMFAYHNRSPAQLRVRAFISSSEIWLIRPVSANSTTHRRGRSSTTFKVQGASVLI
jgi:hypothetical protein